MGGEPRLGKLVVESITNVEYTNNLSLGALVGHSEANNDSYSQLVAIM